MRKATEIKVYWDAQDRSNEGWAYRLSDENGDIESGSLDDASDLNQAIEQAISESGLDLDVCSFGSQPNVDGGYAVWTEQKK